MISPNSINSELFWLYYDLHTYFVCNFQDQKNGHIILNEGCPRYAATMVRAFDKETSGPLLAPSGPGLSLIVTPGSATASRLEGTDRRGVPALLSVRSQEVLLKAKLCLSGAQCHCHQKRWAQVGTQASTLSSLKKGLCTVVAGTRWKVPPFALSVGGPFWLLC